ncbi:MAG: hypothetical protein HKL84_02780 [Acidimicrobiaceae bacterium]|nr:hypothetical protein [Acidimicrobiaceae bacterium]
MNYIRVSGAACDKTCFGDCHSKKAKERDFCANDRLGTFLYLVTLRDCNVTIEHGIT